MPRKNLTVAVIIAMVEEWKEFRALFPPGAVEDLGGHLEISLPVGGKDVTIVASMCSDQGNWASYDAVSRILALNRTIDHWFLVGVAGSLRDNLQLCDVVVSSTVYYYPHRASIVDRAASSLPWTSSPEIPCNDHCEMPEIRFSNQVISGVAPDALNHLESSVRKVPHPKKLGWPVTSKQLLKQFPQLSGLGLNENLQVVKGTLASGDFVCESNWFKHQLLDRGDKKAMAVEMEGYGFARRLSAAQIQNFTIVRGLSDAAGGDKDNLDVMLTADRGKVTQRAAAWMASRTCIHLVALLAAGVSSDTGDDLGVEPAIDDVSATAGAAVASARLAGLLRRDEEVEVARTDYLFTSDSVVILDPGMRLPIDDLRNLAASSLTPQAALDYVRSQGAVLDEATERRLVPVVFRAALDV